VLTDAGQWIAVGGLYLTFVAVVAYRLVTATRLSRDDEAAREDRS
jgi:hypothetical protein